MSENVLVVTPANQADLPDVLLLMQDLAEFEGYLPDFVVTLEALERREETARAERRELGVEDDLAELPILTEGMLVTLGKAGIKTLDDLADLATDELIFKPRQEPRRSNSDRRRTEVKPGILASYSLTEEQVPDCKVFLEEKIRENS